MATAPAIIEGEVIPPAVNQEDNTVRNERSVLGMAGWKVSQLDRIVRDSIEQLNSLTNKGRKEVKERLLPALQEIKRRIKAGETVYGHDTIQSYLTSVGLTDNIVRSWEFRLREQELRDLLPEPTDPTTEAVDEPLSTLEPAEQSPNSVKPIVFPVPNPERISDHTARLTLCLSHFTSLNEVAKRIRTEKLDAPTFAEISTIITTLRKISKDAAEKANLLEIAFKEKAA